jgi:predicted nucleotide-binding protein
MARRPPEPSQPVRPNLTADQKRRCVDRLEKRIQELKVFDPQTVQKRFTDPNVSALEAAIDEALSAAFGHETVEYRRYKRAVQLDHGPVVLRMGGYHDETSEARQYATEGKIEALALLRQAVRSLNEEVEEEGPAAHPTLMAPKNRVFVVHGHDEGAKHAVARFLEKLGLEAIILDEKPDQGRTIIEKFESYAIDVGFAVIVLTPDDVGHLKTASDDQERARQNVIFELGYFVGKLGRGRACLLRKGDVEMPSDLAGVIYTELDAADGWTQRLVRELKAAQIQFDANRLWA